MNNQIKTFELDLDNLHSRIRKARVIVGMNQTLLAERIGSSRSTISQIEKGFVEPKLSVIKSISQVTDQSVTWLLTGKTGFNI